MKHIYLDTTKIIKERGFCSWYEFATEILKLAGLRTPIVPINSNEYPQKARRPLFQPLTITT